MSVFSIDSQQWRRSVIPGVLTVLALSVSACGQAPADEANTLSSTLPKQSSIRSLDEDPCAYGSPILSISDADITVQCGGTWKEPEVTAVDACGNPLEVHRYNTGDDDQDGIPGSIDPDDFGPGPDTSTNGTYYVQYLAWDSYYNIGSAILTLHVVNCPPEDEDSGR